MKQYDFVIVGSGFYGATFAHIASSMGKKCLVIDKRTHIGGNVYTKEEAGINIHCYGAHIFHTNKKVIWDYVHQFASFNNFINSPMANYKGELYNLPFNMNTFYAMWQTKTPSEAQKIIGRQQIIEKKAPQNLEEQAISLVGTDIYQKLIKGYTEKQWGKSCSELPAFIIRRLPIRYTFDNNYFDDTYQGVPIGGYTKLIEKMLVDCDVRLETDYLENRAYYDSIAEKVIYTGTIDQFYDHCYGTLDYRSLHFETEKMEMQNYQGVAVVNYTDKETPYTRMIEHKHFEFGQQDVTFVTKEYPQAFEGTSEPYYPINDEKNQKILELYEKRAQREKKVVFGGRLGSYKYYNMDEVISAAIVKAQELCR